MRRLVVRVLLALVALAGVVVLGACSGDAADPQPADGSVVIDVRTPAEFAAGHLDGALNIDVESADFASRIASLDPHARYVVYCRSGNRAGVAADEMARAGFADVTNAGGLEQAAASTGLAIVSS